MHNLLLNFCLCHYNITSLLLAQEAKGYSSSAVKNCDFNLVGVSLAYDFLLPYFSLRKWIQVAMNKIILSRSVNMYTMKEHNRLLFDNRRSPLSYKKCWRLFICSIILYHSTDSIEGMNLYFVRPALPTIRTSKDTNNECMTTNLRAN